MIISSFSEFESDLLKKQKQKQKKQDKWQNFTDFRQDLRDQSFRTKKKTTNKTNIKVYYSLYNDVNVTPAAIGRCP